MGRAGRELGGVAGLQLVALVASAAFAAPCLLILATLVRPVRTTSDLEEATA